MSAGTAYAFAVPTFVFTLGVVGWLLIAFGGSMAQLYDDDLNLRSHRYFFVCVGAVVFVSVCTAYCLARLVYAGIRWPISPSAGGYCAGCGYDLTGNVTGRCPECGAEVLDQPRVDSPLRPQLRDASPRRPYRHRLNPWAYATISAVVLTGFAVVFLWVRDQQARSRDLSSASVCMANMIYVKSQLFEHAVDMPADTPMAAAVEQLVKDGKIDPSRLVCGCSGNRFKFRGKVGWMQHGVQRRGDEIIVYEPVASHHREVALHVLFARGNSERLPQIILVDKLANPPP